MAASLSLPLTHAHAHSDTDTRLDAGGNPCRSLDNTDTDLSCSLADRQFWVCSVIKAEDETCPCSRRGGQSYESLAAFRSARAMVSVNGPVRTDRTTYVLPIGDIRQFYCFVSENDIGTVR